jgi:hypothetical protein
MRCWRMRRCWLQRRLDPSPRKALLEEPRAVETHAAALAAEGAEQNQGRRDVHKAVRMRRPDFGSATAPTVRNTPAARDAPDDKSRKNRYEDHNGWKDREIPRIHMFLVNLRRQLRRIAFYCTEPSKRPLDAKPLRSNDVRFSPLDSFVFKVETLRSLRRHPASFA